MRIDVFLIYLLVSFLLDLEKRWANFSAPGPDLEDDFDREPHLYLPNEFVAQTYSKTKKEKIFTLICFTVSWR